jgi:hypothetical protein
VKGCTAGARHLAQSRDWLAWWLEDGYRWSFGSLMETALGHWGPEQLERWMAWRRELRDGRVAQ